MTGPHLLELSDDRMWLTIYADNGMKATMRSSRPEGFVQEDLDKALHFEFKTTLEPGQLDHATLHHFLGRPFLVHVNTGPPTWWWPRIYIHRNKVAAGWLRVMYGLSWNWSKKP